MKTITAVLWHNSANRLRQLQFELNKIAHVKIFSAGALSEGEEDMGALYDAIDASDALIFNQTAADQAWTKINEYTKDTKLPIVYIGTEAASFLRSIEQAKWTAVCNSYFTYGGSENLLNMVRWICAELLGENISYGAVDQIPWDAIFAPDSRKTYQTPESYFADHPASSKGTIALVISRSAWVSDDLAIEKAVIREILDTGYSVLPMFTYAMQDAALGTEGPEKAMERYCFLSDGTPCVDAVIRMAGFFNHGASSELMKRLGCPVVKPIASYSMTVEQWKENPDGTVGDVAWSIALPELDGVIEPIFIGAQEHEGDAEHRVPVLSRVKKLVARVEKWVTLKKKENKDKRIVFMLNNNPCTSAEASVGGGANLDTLESIARVLKAMKDAGYTIENRPESGKELIDTIMSRKAISEFRWTTAREIYAKGGTVDTVEKSQYLEWFTELPEELQKSMVETWGEPIGQAMVVDGKMLITGVRFGNVIVCVQPKRGCMGSKCDGTSCKILHDPHIPPTHQYLASYRWFERVFGADALVHVGTHGNLEFLPGKSVAQSDSCCTDACLGNLPFLYIYNADNPPEATIAKRRAMAVTVDHMQTTLVSGGLYDELETLDELLNQYEKTKLSDPTQAHLMEHIIEEEIMKNPMLSYIDMSDYHNNMDAVVQQCHKLLSRIKNTQVQDGMHILGDIPTGKRLVDMLGSILRFEGVETPSLRRAVAELAGLELSELLEKPTKFYRAYLEVGGTLLQEIDNVCRNLIRAFLAGSAFTGQPELLGKLKAANPEKIEQVASFRERVLEIAARIESSREIDALLDGLNGDFIPAGPAGIVTRGRDDVLPTGRNMYSLDPEKVPTRPAWEIGMRLGDSVVQKFREEEGRYPENMAIYWMTTDIMWADGEGMAQLLYLLGVRPKWLPNGKVRSFEIIPLEQLGRPRIDITVKVSGILRDNFQNCIYLVDDAVRAVAALDEPEEMNYIRKHVRQAMERDEKLSFDDACSRLFGAQPGTYSAGVNLLIYSSAWEEQGQIGDLFTLYNQYSYGRKRFGKEAMGVLKQNLSTVELTYDKVMSDEHDLLGCCCYFANHGGMTAAAKAYSGSEIKTYYGDTRETTHVEVRTLGEEINRVVTGKLLNPKWIEGQKRSGYQGAGDISKRVGRVYGWDATTDAVDDRIFDDITRTFIVNEENRQFFMESNPWALEEMSRRLLEASERGLWQPEDGLLEEIQDAYLELEGFLEEDMGDQSGEFQGSDISITPRDEMEIFRKNAAKLHALKGK